MPALLARGAAIYQLLPVTARMPHQRQLTSSRLPKKLIETDFKVKDEQTTREFFTQLTGLYQTWLYSRSNKAQDYRGYRNQIEQLQAAHVPLQSSSIETIKASGDAP